MLHLPANLPIFPVAVPRRFRDSFGLLLTSRVVVAAEHKERKSARTAEGLHGQCMDRVT